MGHLGAVSDAGSRLVLEELRRSGLARRARTEILWSSVLFAVSLSARLLFWRATPDADAGWSVLYQGDAPIWLDYAEALRAHRPFELGLPIHPPGTAYLISALWGVFGPGYGILRAAWALMGAASVVLFSLAIGATFGIRIGQLAGVSMAFSTGLLLLGISPNCETPYLLLVAVIMLLLMRLLERPAMRLLIPCSALQAAACFFRVEHVVFYVASLALLCGVWRGKSGRARPWPVVAPAVGASLLVFTSVLLPWNSLAWRAVARFNCEEPRRTPFEQEPLTRLETSLASLRWEPDAISRRNRLPAFARRTGADFVAATVAYRGSSVVRAADFEGLAEAFGYVPEPLPRHFFVSIAGPLNFALANHAGAQGGFDRTLLQTPPPLITDPGRYPPDLVSGLPPLQLSLVYPPHLLLVNHGYSVGLRWIASEPIGFFRLAVRKLARSWAGAATGWTSHGFPVGLTGTRFAVDLVVAGDGFVTRTFRLLILGLCLLGFLVLRPCGVLAPWLLLATSRLLAAILFFGYARMGATVIPVVALLIAGALVRLSRGVGVRLRRPTVVLAAALALGLTAEVIHATWGMRLAIDSRPIPVGERPQMDLAEDRAIEVH